RLARCASTGSSASRSREESEDRSVGDLERRDGSEEQGDRGMEARLELLERAIGEEIVGAHDDPRPGPPEDAEESADARRPGGRLEVFDAHRPKDVARESTERGEGYCILDVRPMLRPAPTRRHEARELAHHLVPTDAHLEVETRGGRPGAAPARAIRGHVRPNRAERASDRSSRR